MLILFLLIVIKLLTKKLKKNSYIFNGFMVMLMVLNLVITFIQVVVTQHSDSFIFTFGDVI